MKHMNVEGVRTRGERDAVRAEIIDSIASWCDALSGGLSLDIALEDLVVGLGAQAGMIVRTYLDDLRPVHIASCDLAGRKTLIHPLKCSFAAGCFGPHFARARPATIWSSSARDDPETADPTLTDWQDARGLKEFVVLVLASGPRVQDHIELHFPENLPQETEATLTVVLPTMVRVWATRKVGLVTRSIIHQRNGRADKNDGVKHQNLLGLDNPAHLTRAEFRVCLLFSYGLSVPAVSEELSRSEATVRTHLRNIYAKTGTNSLAELVFHLVRSDDVPAPGLARIA